MFAFQITSLLYEDRYLDEVEIYWLLPIMMIIIPFVYFIRVKLFDKHVLGIDLEAMEKELNNYRKNEKTTSHKDNDDKIEKKKEIHIDKEPIYKYQSFSEYLNTSFSTDNIEKQFRQFQNNLRGWLHLKF